MLKGKFGVYLRTFIFVFMALRTELNESHIQMEHSTAKPQLHPWVIEL